MADDQNTEQTIATPMPDMPTPVQVPANSEAEEVKPTVIDGVPREHLDPSFMSGGCYVIDPVTGKRVPA